MKFSEEMDVEVVSGLSEKEWERLKEEFSGAIQSNPHPTQQRFSFALTVKQSALFTKHDLERLVEILKPPYSDPENWTIGELGGRKTLYADRGPTLRNFRTPESFVTEFVEACFDIHGNDGIHVSKKEVWVRFFYWSRTTYPECKIEMDLFFELFERLYGKDFVRKTKRGILYEGFKIKIRGIPPFPA